MRTIRCISILHISCLVMFPLYSMDLGTVVVTNPIVINTREDLKKFVQIYKEKGTEPTTQDLQGVHIDQHLIVELMISLTLGNDNPSPSLKVSAAKSVRSLEQNNGQKLQKHTSTIILQALKHDGDLTAQTVSARKQELANSARETLAASARIMEQKKEPKADTLSRRRQGKEKEKAEPKGASKESLRLDLEKLKQGGANTLNEAFDEEFAQAKQDMRNLILQAAEDAIEGKSQDAQRNFNVGVASTVVTGIVGPLITALITYYSTSKNNSPPGTNSTGT